MGELLTRYNKIISWLVIVFALMILYAVMMQSYIVALVLFGLFLCPFALYIVCRWPDFGLFISMGLSFIPVSEDRVNVLLCLIAIILNIYILLKKSIKKRLDIITLSWLIIVINCILTMAKWSNLQQAIKGVYLYILLPYTIYAFINSELIDAHGVGRILKKYIPAVVVFSLIQVFWVYVFNINISVLDRMSMHSGFDVGWAYSNTLAAILALFFAALYANPILNTKNVLLRGTVILLMSMCVIVCLLIVSRGALLSIVIGFTVFRSVILLIDKKLSLRKLLLISSTVITAGMVLFSNYISAVIDRFVHLQIDASFQARLYVVFDSYKQMVKQPFIGAGPNQYQYQDFYELLLDPHNVFLRYGVDFGIISMLAIFTILIYPIIRIYRLYKIDKAFAREVIIRYLFPVSVAIVNSQFEAAITKYNYGIIFWIYYALMNREISKSFESLAKCNVAR